MKEKSTKWKLNFDLPWPPSTNMYYRMWNNCIIISKKGRAYSAECKITYIQQLKKPQTIDCRLKVTAILCAPDKRKRDLDNFGGKALLDALTKAQIIADDSLIDELHLYRGPIIKNGKVEVTLEELR